MTPEEQLIYSLHLFDLGDLVEIDESDLLGEIIGMNIQIGREDSYLISYHDGCGNPKREWWPASALESADDTEVQSNVIQFPVSATRH